MKREIKFRGLTISGKWVYGLLSISQGRNQQPEIGQYISNSYGMPWAYQVRPETVGQFTGRLDKNGKEIYEGDINQHGGVVVWNDDFFDLFDASFVWDYHNEATQMENERSWCEIIGNVYENPELVNGKSFSNT